MPRTPPIRWTPPAWLIGLDAMALVLLGLGLAMHFAPDSGLARSLPEPARLALLVVGGVLFAVCWVLLAVSVIGHARRRRGG